MLISVALDPRALKGRTTPEFKILRALLDENGALGCSNEGILEIAATIQATDLNEGKRWETLLLDRLPRTKQRVESERWGAAERDNLTPLDAIDTMWIPCDETFAAWALSEKIAPLSKEFPVARTPRVDVVALEAAGDAEVVGVLSAKQNSYLDKTNPRLDLWQRMRPLLMRSRELQIIDPYLFGGDAKSEVRLGKTLEFLCSRIGSLDPDLNLALNLFGSLPDDCRQDEFETFAEKAWKLTNGCLRELQVVPVPFRNFRVTGHDRELKFTIRHRSGHHSRWLNLTNSLTALDREPITKNVTCIYRSTVTEKDDAASKEEIDGFRKAAENVAYKGLGIFTRSRAV